MKKKIAQWLLRLAKRLDPQKEFILADQYEPKALGIGYHITKNDVREYRKHNPEIKSHREGLKRLIEDQKKEIGTNIFAAIYKNDLIDYNVKKTLWVADVTGRLYVYTPKVEESAEE